MKVLLVNPSLISETIGHYQERVEKQRGLYPPLGLAYIAAALDKTGHEVEVIDLDAECSKIGDWEKLLDEFQPEVLGVYTMTWTFRQANELVRRTKNRLPEITVIAGGPNVASFPRQTLTYGQFDYGVIGEGEETVIELLSALAGELNLGSVKGIVFRENGKIKQTESRPYIGDTDNISFPARCFLPMTKYFDVFTRERSFATMITSRGCPFDCSYCDRENRMGHRWRARSAENIVAEIKEVQAKYQIREFMFFDDEFVIDRNRTYAFCDQVQTHCPDIIWECRARVDMVDKKLLKVMKQSGCYRIRFGFEAGDNRILEVLNKGITVEQSLRCARDARDAGIEIFGYFMLGSPEETEETLQKTIALALEIEPDFAIFSKTILIPGSKLFDWAVANDQIAHDYWEKFLRGEETNAAPAISTENLPEKVIDQYIAKANRSFYFRPKYICGRLRKIQNYRQLVRQARIARSLLH